ncbi:hypothetical protein HDU67_003652, partial [Dinochytrium kinnereticum]
RSAAQFFREGEDSKGDDDDGRKDGQYGDALRKTTPPQAAQAVDDKGKKGAVGTGGKDAKGKGQGAAKAPAKGGKKVAEAIAADAEETPQRPTLAKIGLKQAIKPDSSNQWTRDRKLAEIQYKRTFTSEISNLVSISITRMCHLFDDVAAGRQRANSAIASDSTRDARGMAMGWSMRPGSGSTGRVGRRVGSAGRKMR